MIIINCGMPKSGTTLLVRYQRDLLACQNQANGMEEIFKHTQGGYIPAIDKAAAEMLREVNDTHGSIVVKTHTSPTKAITSLIESGVARATFSYRDPRDTVLSALDHGARSRNGKDASGSFANLTSVSEAIGLANQALKAYSDWQSFGKAHFVRYETLMENKVAEIGAMANYFDIGATPEDVEKIYKLHESIKQKAWNFNKGTTYRWLDEMAPEDVLLCLDAFQQQLEEMGYSANRKEYRSLIIRRRLTSLLPWLRG